jgi:hypothetical protein
MREFILTQLLHLSILYLHRLLKAVMHRRIGNVHNAVTTFIYHTITVVQQGSRHGPGIGLPSLLGIIVVVVAVQDFIDQILGNLAQQELLLGRPLVGVGVIVVVTIGVVHLGIGWFFYKSGGRDSTNTLSSRPNTHRSRKESIEFRN